MTYRWILSFFLISGLLPGDRVSLSGKSGDSCLMIRVQQFLKTPNETRFVGTVTGDSIIGTHQTDWWLFPSRAIGRVIDVEQAEGRFARELQSDNSASQVVVYRWGLSPACTRVPTQQFPEPSSRQVLRAELRADSLWENGLPTFDLIPPNKFMLYPGEWTDGGRGTGASKSPSVEEYLELIDLAPERGGCQPLTDYHQSLDDWIKGHPWTEGQPVVEAILSDSRTGIDCLENIRIPFEVPEGSPPGGLTPSTGEYSLTGSVTLADGRETPLSSTLVEISPDSGVPHRPPLGVVTDHAGIFNKEELASGTYVVRVHSNCNHLWKRTVELGPENPAESLRITVTPIRPKPSINHRSCPATLEEDRRDRPVILALLQLPEVRSWLDPWLQNGLGSVATEFLTWGSTIDVGDQHFRVVAPQRAYSRRVYGPTNMLSQLHLSYSMPGGEGSRVHVLFLAILGEDGSGPFLDHMALSARQTTEGWELVSVR